MKTLIISGHTDLKTSVANKTILDTLGAALPEARIVKLDELYPDFNVNVEAEQQNLVWADTIVMQYPVFWYSMPSLLHRYIEQVFVHGFSHGSKGDKLKGKRLIMSFTTGAPAEAYTPERITIDQITLPARAMCALTGLVFDGYVYTGGVSYASRTTPEEREAQVVAAREHAARLIEKIGK